MSLRRPVTRAFGVDGDGGGPLRVVIYARRSAAGGTSAADQARMGREDAARFGWPVVAVAVESGQSASMYRKNGAPRAEWGRVLALVAAGEVDVVWVRATSRADRKMSTWAPFLDDLRLRGVGLYVQGDRKLYDLSVWRDHKTLLEDGIDNADESAKKSKLIKDGVDDNVRAGLPLSAAPLGYRNLYDERTRKLTGREKDPVWSPVAVEMFDRVGRGDSLASVARWLNERGAPALRRGAVWDAAMVRHTCEDRAYIAERVHTFAGDDTSTVMAMGWPALVDRAQWSAAQSALARIAQVHAVRGRAPGAFVNLVSFIATCGICDTPVTIGNSRGVKTYVCPTGHVVLNQDDTDAYVARLVVARVARADLFASLTASDDDVIRKAEDDIKRIKAELAELTAAVKTRSGLARLAALDAISDLETELNTARERLESLAVPASLRELAHGAQGDEAAVRANWAGMSMAARRDAVRYLLAYFKILPAPVVGTNPRTGKPVRARGVRGALDVRRVVHAWRDYRQPSPANADVA
jgi:DNA invertase Pin-like site-specific DNA recombinase